MAIGNVIEKRGVVYVYRPDGSMGVQINVSNLPGSGLKGYTSNTFNIQQGGSIYTYNESGQVIGSHYVGNSALPSSNRSRKGSSGGSGDFFQSVFGLIALVIAYWYFFL